MDTGGRNVASYTFLLEILKVCQGRDLTDQNDALNAMSGILQRVAATAKTKIVQGLPADIFPVAILFIHTRGRAPGRRKAFPSWSWCGWKGETSWYPFDKLDLMNAADEDNDFNEDIEIDRAMSRDWITYYTERGSSQPEMIWTPANQQQLKGVDGGLALFQALPRVDGADLELNNIGQISELEQQEPRIRNYSLLVFQTLTVQYRLKTIPKGGDTENYDLDAARPSFQDYKSRIYEISGSKDEYCGILYADERLLRLEEENVMKFVVLGECYKVEFPLEFDFEAEVEEDEPAFWVKMVMLIDGIWERRGIGQTLQSSLKNSYSPGTRWEQIELG